MLDGLAKDFADIFENRPEALGIKDAKVTSFKPAQAAVPRACIRLNNSVVLLSISDQHGKCDFELTAFGSTQAEKGKKLEDKTVAMVALLKAELERRKVKITGH